MPGTPPPAPVDGRVASCPDVERIDARLELDAGAGEGRGSARVQFRMTVDGSPLLDLRQAVDSVRLDGRAVETSAWRPVDLGGGVGAEMRLLEVDLAAASRHELEIGYSLGRPDCAGAEPVGWQAGGGVRFDLWMSDLAPGRYLEQWIPAPLCHDRFALTVELMVTGTDRAHVAVTNGEGDGGGEPNRRWLLHYPPSFTSLSPMLVVAPADQVELHRSAVVSGPAGPLEVLCARHLEVDADLEACAADIAAWVDYLRVRYGPWVHGQRCTAFVWGPGRGMEYDGATTASVGALEHEVFHSWFGRGVKPAHASDGWIDEAWTSWATASRRVEQPRFAAAELGLDEDPALLCPPSPWSRHTPVAAYDRGSRLFAGVAHALGGADRLRSAMGGWYRMHAGGMVDTDGLQAHLQARSEVDLGPLFTRYVHGQ